MDKLSWTPIGEMRTCFKTKNGTPRQGTISSSSRGILSISKQIFTNPDHSLEGLKEYSHVWILFAFHLNEEKGVKAKVKPPRLNGAKLGVFATRSPHRPNPIGLTLAKLEYVDGSTIAVSGLDIVDGTPILDIKPYIPIYDAPKQQQESACDLSVAHTKADSEKTTNDAEENVASNIQCVDSTLWSKPLLPKLDVIFTKRAENDIADLQKILRDPSHEFMVERQHLRKAIVEVLCADPRSTYRRKKCCDRLYYFVLDDCHVTAWFDYSCEPALVEVLRVKQLHMIKGCLQSTSDIDTTES